MNTSLEVPRVKRQWRKFAAAYSLTITGDRFLDIATPVASIAITHSLSYSGLYIAANSIPRFIAGPLLSRRMLRNPSASWCSFGNWIQAAGISILGCFMLLEFLAPFGFVLAGLIAGVGSALYGIASQATIRNLVVKERLPQANSTLEVIDSALTLLIPLVAGSIVLFLGPTVAIIVTSLAFVGAALLRMGLSPDPESVKGPESSTKKNWLLGYIEDLGVPFKGNIRRFISLSGLSLSASSLLLIPIATLQILSIGGNSADVGIAISAAGVGGLITGFLAGRFTRITRSTIWLTLALVAIFVMTPLIFLTKPVSWTIVLVGLCDALAAWLYVTVPTMRMTTEENHSLVRISAGMMSLNALFSLAIGVGISLFTTHSQLFVVTLVISLCAILAHLLSGTKALRRGIKAKFSTV